MSSRNTIWDAGHGGHDAGAVNGVTGDREKDIALAVAIKCHEYSLRAGIPSSLTRSTDGFLTLSERVRIANNSDADLCSIHCNAFNRTAKGFEVFTTRGNTFSDKWATLAYEEYDKDFPDRTSRSDFSDGDPDKEAGFTVLTTKGRAILFELGFIDNVEEAKFLNDNIDKMAQSLVNARLRDLGLPTQNFINPPSQQAIVEIHPSEVIDPVDYAKIKERIGFARYQLNEIEKLLP